MLGKCEICHEAREASHHVFGPDNDGELRFVSVCCECLEHAPEECTNA